MSPPDAYPVPPDALGAATLPAALAVDRVAIHLLGACGPFDPQGERLARVRRALAELPAMIACAQELARVAGVPLQIFLADNDQANAPTRQHVNDLAA